MKGKALAVAVAVVVAAIAWAWWGHYTDRPTQIQAQAPALQVAPAASTIQPAVSKSAASTAPSVTIAATPTSAEPIAASLQRLTSDYECSDCSEDSPFAARSTAEAMWMASRGFPTREQLQNMDSLDQARLRAAADQGDLVAMGLYGTVLLKEGQRAEGIGYLTKAEMSGSVYAMYGLSESKMPPHRFADKYSAASYVRLAYLLGDSRASDYLYKHFAGYDSGEWALIDRDASMYFRRLRAAQARKFGAPPPILPRPPTPEKGASDR